MNVPSSLAVQPTKFNRCKTTFIDATCLWRKLAHASLPQSKNVKSCGCSGELLAEEEITKEYSENMESISWLKNCLAYGVTFLYCVTFAPCVSITCMLIDMPREEKHDLVAHNWTRVVITPTSSQHLTRFFMVLRTVPQSSSQAAAVLPACVMYECCLCTRAAWLLSGVNAH